MNRNDLPQANNTCETCGHKYRRCNKCSQMRNRGIEAWRARCDCIECYQTLIFSQTDDLSTITREQYNTIISYELPEGRKPIKEIQDKLDAIDKYLTEQEEKEKLEQKEQMEKQNIQSTQNEIVNKTNKTNYFGSKKKGLFKSEKQVY